MVELLNPSQPNWPGAPLEAAWQQMPAEWRVLRWPVTTPPFEQVFHHHPGQLAGDVLQLDLEAFPGRVGREVAWYVWRSWQDGDRKFDALVLRRWAVAATEWQHRQRSARSGPGATSVLDIPPQEI